METAASDMHSGGCTAAAVNALQRAFGCGALTAPASCSTGVMGGSVPNAALVLAQLLSQLHDPESAMVKVPGFYKVCDAAHSQRSQRAQAVLATALTPAQTNLACRASSPSQMLTTRSW